MIDMRRALAIDVSADAVFAYLADFTTTEGWDPGTVRTVRLSGDGGLGTRYLNTSRFAGRTSDLIYEVVALKPGNSLQLRGENASLIAVDTITVTPHPSGRSLITYRIQFAFQGWLRWLEPVLRLPVTRLLDEGVSGIRRELARI